MYGTWTGNLLAVFCLLLYQLAGISIIRCFFKKEQKNTILLFGSVLGNLLLQWLPVVFSFFMGFTIQSNLAAMALAGILGTVAFCRGGLRLQGWTKYQKPQEIWWLIVPVFFVYAYLLYTHTIPVKNGAMMTGQSTYGDMSLHLSIITSLANQGKFPPEYSILPGNRLSYPFLSDSISSTLYLFGSSLKFAYILPMLVAIIQVMYGFYYLMQTLFKKKAVSLLAWIFFFFNGGFGILYFLNGAVKDPSVFTRIFTGYYETPTNLLDENIRWANTIVDFLVPQRATLFGWAVFFPALAWLYKTVFEEKTVNYQIFAGIWIGCLPMIHTHSFLSLAVVTAFFCYYDLLSQHPYKKKLAKWLRSYLVMVMIGVLLGMSVLAWFQEKIPEKAFALFPAVVIAFFAATGIALFIYEIKHHGIMRWLKNWGFLLAIILLLALPQLCIWTFRQAGTDGFIRLWFNWGNEGDPYLWFYLKNIGLVAVLAIPAFMALPSKYYKIIIPGMFIWFVAEFMLFQPNPYDNNKLLYPVYGIVCGIAALYLTEKAEQMARMGYRRIFLFCMIGLASVSAVLTMGREVVSEYELYSAQQVRLAEFIEDYTDAQDVILTNTRHNNSIACLTGRNIVCGSSTFLAFHGLDYQGREAAVKQFYETPKSNMELLEEFHVAYIVVSEFERNEYLVDEQALQEMFSVVYDEDGIQVYEVTASD